MDILEIWNHPELFEKYNFSALDRKVQIIEKIRECSSLYDKVIKELNNRVDIDYIKDSELLEGNEIFELRDINFDEDFEELYETNIFDKRVKNPGIDDFFFGKYRTVLKNGRLVIYRKDPVSNKIFQFKCAMPQHLKALKNALTRARKEQALISAGKNVDVTTKFIENVHEEMFQDYIFINTRQSRYSTELIKPAGYGEFRKTIFIRGNEHKYNVEVEGANWQPTDSNEVGSEMEQLLKCYNSSKLHPILKAALFKICFIKIHPFRDGNGRTSRILLNYMLVREGYPTVTIRGIFKDKYFSALDSAIEEGNYSQIISMIVNELEQRCEQYLNLITKLDLKKQLKSEDDCFSV